MTKPSEWGGDLLNQKHANLFLNKMIQIPVVPQTGNNWTLTTTGTTQPDHDREDEVAQITKKHSKNYWYTISVNDTEDVLYNVYRSGNLVHWWFKLTGKEPKLGALSDVSGGWVSVKKRTHLPATLGAAYQEIDKAIAGHKEIMEHDEYLTEMLKTEPENLKMIEGLEKLEEGEPDDPNVTYATGPGQIYTYSNNVAIGGTGTYSGNATAISNSIAGELEAHVAEAVAKSTDELVMDLLKDGMKGSEKVAEVDAQ